MVLPALREKNLAKIEVENDKKTLCCLAKSEREEKLKNFLKRMFWNCQRTVFKKSEIWSKNKFDQSNQAEAHLIF